MNHLGGFFTNRDDKGTWAPIVWDNLLAKFKPASIIDVGCGLGYTLEYFISNYNIEGIGIEGSQEAINLSPIKEKLIQHDYTLSEYIPSQKYDLGWSCEFVEHVEEKYLNNFMMTFKYCKIVSMTHALPSQDGHHHVNCKDSLYWIEKFKENGFQYLSDLSLELRNLIDTKIYGAYIKNTLMIFKNED